MGDGAEWVLDEIGQNLAAYLPRRLSAKVVTHQWKRARGCLIHFINRMWAWSDDALTGVHPSNRLIGVWWHGRLDDSDAEMKASLDRLRRSHSKFVRIQVPCSSARETLHAIGVPEARIVLLPLGVDVRRFRPPSSNEHRIAVRRELGIQDHAFAIGCFQKDGQGWGDGQTAKLVKGPDVLADVMTRLRGRYPVHAVLPGPARGFVRARLEEAGVPFSAPGFIPRDRLASLYHALDVYISPSRDEGGPAGVLESMASGVPVVSTRTGMATDLIEPSVNGALVDIDDAEGLAARAAELIESDELRQRYAANALRTIEQYDWPLVANRYAAELYRPVLDES